MKITISSEAVDFKQEGGISVSIPASEIELPPQWVKAIHRASLQRGVLPTTVVRHMLSKHLPGQPSNVGLAIVEEIEAEASNG